MDSNVPEMAQITVLGIGNILLTDEGVGVRVVERLRREFSFPPNVVLYDGGTGGMSLLSVIERTDHLIVVDAVLVNEPPGTIVKFDFESTPADLERKMSAHDINIIDVLRMAETLDKRPPTVIIGIQPGDISTYSTALSREMDVPGVMAAVLEELRSIGVEPMVRERKRKLEDGE